jgi:type II secretory pathway pseudopilin PulG
VSRRGTTLLETLVALGITALVLAALARLVGGAHAARADVTAAADRTAAARSVLLGLAAELEASRSPGAAVEPGPPERPWSALSLATIGRPRAAASDLLLVTYRVVPAAGGGVLVRGERARPVPPGTAEPPGTELLRGVRRFRVRCFDGEAWTETWAPGPLPRAVEIALGVDDGRGGSEELVTAVALPAAGGGA